MAPEPLLSLLVLEEEDEEERKELEERETLQFSPSIFWKASPPSSKKSCLALSSSSSSKYHCGGKEGGRGRGRGLHLARRFHLPPLPPITSSFFFPSLLLPCVEEEDSPAQKMWEREREIIRRMSQKKHLSTFYFCTLMISPFPTNPFLPTQCDVAYALAAAQTQIVT